MSPPSLEFWFEFASTYSYVAAMRIESVAAEAGVRVAWKPFLLGPIFTEQQGIRDSPFNVNPIRGRYMWRDMERLCEKYLLPLKRPSVFPRNSVLPARVALLGSDEEWGPRFVRAVYVANFAHDRDIAKAEVIREVLQELRLDAEAILQRAESPEHKGRLREQTGQAVQHGIFGAPNFLVNGELFFGQDRMDDALAWAKRAQAHRP